MCSIIFSALSEIGPAWNNLTYLCRKHWNQKHAWQKHGRTENIRVIKTSFFIPLLQAEVRCYPAPVTNINSPHIISFICIPARSHSPPDQFLFSLTFLIFVGEHRGRKKLYTNANCRDDWKRLLNWKMDFVRKPASVL